MDIKIGVRGVILTGHYADWTIYIEKDGPYYVMYLHSEDGKTNYDSFSPDYPSLKLAMEQEGISEVEWLS